MIQIQAVKFKGDAKVPCMGERGGLSLVRALGGNDQPVEHEITLDPSARLLRIRSLTRPDEPECIVPLENVRWCEAKREERTADRAHRIQDDPHDVTQDLGPPTESDRAKRLDGAKPDEPASHDRVARISRNEKGVKALVVDEDGHNAHVVAEKREPVAPAGEKKGHDR